MNISLKKGAYALFMGMLLVSCGAKKSNAAETEEASDKETVENVAEEKTEEEEIVVPLDTAAFEKHVINELFVVIPDHEIGDKGKLVANSTRSLSSLLIEAFDMPVMYPGEIGDEEFLYYFLTGNGDMEPAKSSAKVKNFNVDGKKANVDVAYAGRVHELKLEYKDGKWLLDDFDGQKEAVKEYVETARKYFTSGEYLNNEFGNDAWRQEVKDYLKIYRHD